MKTKSLLSALVVSALSVFTGCRTPPPRITYQVQELGVVKDVLPIAVQPDLAKWGLLKVGMTESDVTNLLGNPYRKQARPSQDTNAAVRRLYGWDYGEITFNSFTTQGTFSFQILFHEGRVHEISDPWNGRFSLDGQPTVPALLFPKAGQELSHYPRFMDFRWLPASGGYPIEYEVVIQSLNVSQQEAEHLEDYIRKTVDLNRASWRERGMSNQEMEESAAVFAKQMREQQGVMDTFLFRTHDIYLPFTWVGANTGRYRVRATNEKGTSPWTSWRYFQFVR